MRRFAASIWLPFLTALILAAVTTAAYALLKPVGADLGNSEILRYSKMAGWANGFVMGLLFFLLVGILNLIRRIFRLRQISGLDGLTVLLGAILFVSFAWQLASEPRYTDVAKAVIDFAARPLLWGSLAAALFAALMSLIVFFFPLKK